MTSQIEYQGASAASIQHHYDVGNDFYALWLDPGRVYSCALWADVADPAEPLERAQQRKFDYLIGQANAAGAKRVLDVGCGWGGLLHRLVEVHGVDCAVGLTLSDAQAQYVAGWADGHYDVRVQNWAEHDPAEPYDAIISIGAFEHFADMGLTRAGRIAAYHEFFERCRDWLPPGGRLALQTNVKGNNVKMSRQTVRDMLFIIDKIFPQSELPWTSEIIEASERSFEIVSFRNDADHYARTCREWLRGLLAHRAEAEELVGPATVVDYERYLAAAADAFDRRHLNLVRIGFARV